MSAPASFSFHHHETTMMESSTSTSTSSSSSSSSTSSSDCTCPNTTQPMLPELTWILFSFLLYSCVMLYIGYQASRQSYAGNRNTGTRLRFPENMTSMLYVWLVYALFGAVVAFLAYLLGGGWTHPTSIVLSMFLLMEVLHYGWMTSFFRFSAYAKAICMKLAMLGVQTYMLLLYFMIDPAIALLYLIVLAVSLYEFLGNVLMLVRSCRSQLRIIPQRDHRAAPSSMTTAPSSGGEEEEGILQSP